MRIGFESQLFIDKHKTGIGWCADNIVKELSKDCDCQCDYIILRQKKVPEGLQEYESYGVRMNVCRWFHPFLYKLIWPILPLPYSWLFGKDREITQFFNFVVPPGVKGKAVTIVHDMAYMAYPETVNEKTKKWLQMTLKPSCKRADAIVTVSEFSKQELIKYMGIAPEKITVMPNGVDLNVYHPNYAQEQVASVKDKYQIKGAYFLYLGTLEPRKNLEALIRAYAMLRQKQEAPLLVLAGGKGWLYDSIFQTVQELHLEEHVIFTGYIDGGDSPLLMKGARAFVFPSLYEGFGMPPLEAMACGTPVITSNNSSLPEVVGDAGLLVDPGSQQEICDAMARLANDDELCKSLSQKGIERAQGFTWKHSADVLRALYQKLLAQNEK